MFATDLSAGLREEFREIDEVAAGESAERMNLLREKNQEGRTGRYRRGIWNTSCDDVRGSDKPGQSKSTVYFSSHGLNGFDALPPCTAVLAAR